MRLRPALPAAGALALVLPGAAGAETVLAPVIVVPRAPLGAIETLDRTPAATVVLHAGDLRRPAAGPALLGALELRTPGLSLSDAQGNPYQPNLVYRGFEASPLQGAGQGLAVYLDGARFNQPFGDTVNWDLIPEAAIEAVSVEGSNPVFGLNAVGGALTVRLKDGFDIRGAAAEAQAGSFGRRSITLEAGGRPAANAGLYVAVSALDEDGWRDFSPTRLRQAYAAWVGGAGPLTLEARLLAADNSLTGNGAAPVELLAADRRAVFTHPDRTDNRFARLQLGASSTLGAGRAATVQAYVGRLRQKTANGDATDAEPCEYDAAVLCLDEDGPLLTDAAGRPIPAFREDGRYAQLNRTATRTWAYGVAAQVTSDRAIQGRDNRLTLGASYDVGRTGFLAQSLLGALTQDRGFGGPGTLVVQADGPISPVQVDTRSQALGLYLLDTRELTERLTLTLSARYNLIDIRLRDRLGEALDGDHRFSRLNPAAGLTWEWDDARSAYAGYAEANRAPTPAELSCASPEAPCSLTNFFVADPPLKQVKARTFEAGLRQLPALDRRLTWRIGVYRTETRDDITLVASAFRGRGYFQNVGRTRRQGVEAEAGWRRGDLQAWASYALTDATFRSPLTLTSPSNPSADDDGRIEAAPGDRMPNVPRHRLKLGLTYAPEPFRLDLSVLAASGRRLAGDEANLQPKTSGYAIANLAAAWQAGEGIELFAAVENLTDARYETFGTFGQTDEVELAEAPGASDPRSLGPGRPRTWTVGLRARF
ncbi:TonB-dependent receptor [Phenylobacterium sp.]|uniref:TonB-dependent receptor n=1 Tax=Phenylobacterium sp. TaxID=1871053 RepID=UPI0035B08F0F